MRIGRAQITWVSGWLARATLAAVFAVAALPKLQDPSGFAAAIDNYHLLSNQLTRIAALGLPTLEIVIAVALLLPQFTRGASLLATLLLVVFSIAMVQAMARDIDLNCGCFGTSAEINVDVWSVARNVALCVLAGWSLFTARVSHAGSATLTKL